MKDEGFATFENRSEIHQRPVEYTKVHSSPFRLHPLVSDALQDHLAGKDS